MAIFLAAAAGFQRFSSTLASLAALLGRAGRAAGRGYEYKRHKGKEYFELKSYSGIVVND